MARIRIGISGWRYKSWRGTFYFFDNTDVKLRAPFDAQSLMRKLELEPRKRP